MKNNIKKVAVVIVSLALVFVLIKTAQAETYTADLTTGSTGAQVVSLQTLLEGKGFLVMPAGIAKGYFGSKTRTALIALQKSLGLPSTGYFGPMTRGRLNKGVQVSSLTVTTPDGGEIWAKGGYQTITWNAPQYFRATNVDIKLVPYYEQMQCPAGYVCMPVWHDTTTYPLAMSISVDQHAYVWKVGTYLDMSANLPNVGVSLIPQQTQAIPEGQYTIQICESGTNVCDSSDNAFTISKEQVVAPTVRVTSPNGGEFWQINSAHLISWTNTDMASTSKVDLYIMPIQKCPVSVTSRVAIDCGGLSVITLDKNIQTSSIYNWVAGTDVVNNYLPAGEYKVKICAAGTENCDYSDNTFNLVGTSTQTTVAVLAPNGGESVKIGQTLLVRWSTNNLLSSTNKFVISGIGPAIAVNESATTTSYSYALTIPTYGVAGDAMYALQPGQYKIKVSLYDGLPPVGRMFSNPLEQYGKIIAEDESDSFITVTNK